MIIKLLLNHEKSLSFDIYYGILYVKCSRKGKKFNSKQKQKVEQIKNGTTYYWGQSKVCSSSDDAEKESLDQLLKDIAKKCKPNAIYLPNDIEPEKQLENIIMTFECRINEKSNDILLIEDIDDREFCYFKYIKRSDFNAMRDDRKKNVENFAKQGLKYENDVQFEDALKYYYRGLMLCYAHPYGKHLKISVPSNQIVDYANQIVGY